MKVKVLKDLLLSGVYADRIYDAVILSAGRVQVINDTGDLITLVGFTYEEVPELDHIDADCYTYISDKTGISRQTVKGYLYETVLCGKVFLDAVRRYELSYTQVTNLINAFNEWTGAAK